ncbi:hypothetical protein BJ508DRAFT_62530 [Ascobolus immersus RN42]|uniref:Uncharacterized protein n=1 Tax=Ascobolus immersus RN42 TaxID=1160509 RepID=A0A3N4IPD7_ASCIM|nr:hypothetical protein BJ508DRAFT_62530 [Ascobolus immersus RN42]
MSIPVKGKDVGKSIKNEQKKSRIVYNLDTPFTATEWPAIEQNHQTTILQLLENLLDPIGQYRAVHLESSKGKRAKHADRKRKREDAEQSSDIDLIIPDKPEIAPYVTVGLNATTNALEQLTRATAPLALNRNTDRKLNQTNEKPRNSLQLQTGTSEAPLQAVFVCRADGQPSQLHAHLPLMCVMASTSEHTVFLIQLPKGAEGKLSERLAVPRVGFLGLKKGAPGAEVLYEYIGKHIPAVRRPGWLEKTGEYIGIKPKALHTIAGTQRPKGGNKTTNQKAS